MSRSHCQDSDLIGLRCSWGIGGVGGWKLPQVILMCSQVGNPSSNDQRPRQLASQPSYLWLTLPLASQERGKPLTPNSLNFPLASQCLLMAPPPPGQDEMCLPLAKLTVQRPLLRILPSSNDTQFWTYFLLSIHYFSYTLNDWPNHQPLTRS